MEREETCARPGFGLLFRMWVHDSCQWKLVALLSVPALLPVTILASRLAWVALATQNEHVIEYSAIQGARSVAIVVVRL